MQVKTEDQKFRNVKSFFIVYLYNQSSNKHTFLRFSGAGNSSGWLTIQLPFDADRILGDNLQSAPVVMLKLENLSGKFSFRNFSLIELPSSADTARGVVTPEGKKQTGSSYRIKKL